MKLFRLAPYKVFFIAFWCVTIINMNFYLIEVKTLTPNNKALIENAKKILTSVAEEEDTSESGETNFPSLAEDAVDDDRQVIILHTDSRGAKLAHSLAIVLNARNGHLELYSPPPEFLI